MTNVPAPTLDVIQESFEDIPLSYDNHSKHYGTPRKVARTRLEASPKPASKTLAGSKAAGTVGAPAAVSPTLSATTSLTSSQRYRLKMRQRMKEIERDATLLPSVADSFDFLSDDELPDDLIVYDVPFSRALSDHRVAYRHPMMKQFVPRPPHGLQGQKRQQMQQRQPVRTQVRPQLGPQRPHQAFQQSSLQKSPQRSLSPQHSQLQVPVSLCLGAPPPFGGSGSSSSATNSMGLTSSISSTSSSLCGSSSSSRSSPATRASSIFSIGSDASELNFLDDESCLSFEGKLLSSNKDLHLEESLQRISMLKNMMHLSADAKGADAKGANASREKLQCLSVTRQSNLPPKDSIESLKHQQAYQHMVEVQVQEEREKIEKYRRQQEKLKRRSEHDRKLWKMILQKYDELVCLPSTRELWWRGIPQQGATRVQTWKRQLVGKKQFKADLAKCLQRSHEIIQKACDYKTTSSELGRLKFRKENKPMMDAIESVEVYSKRIQKCFPNLVVFQLGATFESVLQVAVAFDIAKVKEGMGHVDTRGLLALVCVLLKNLETEELTLHALLDISLKKLPHELLTNKTIPDSLEAELKCEKKEQNQYLGDIKDQFDRFLLNSSPNVYNHFVQHDVNTLKIIQHTVGSLFSEQLSMDIMERIMDIFVFEGDTFLLRVLLALIKKVSYKLFGSRDEIYELLGHNCLDVLNADNDDNNNNTKTGYAYLDVGEPDDFIQDVRSILRKHA